MSVQLRDTKSSVLEHSSSQLLTCMPELLTTCTPVMSNSLASVAAHGSNTAHSMTDGQQCQKVPRPSLHVELRYVCSVERY